MMDDDFPPPKHVQAAPIVANIAAMREAYEASPEFAAVKRENIVSRVFGVLGGLAKHDAEAVAWAAYDWLAANKAGLPAMQSFDAVSREDARFWAETATPSELEFYALAACDKLSGRDGNNPLFASRQIKRLIGALVKMMSPDERAAFKKWIEGQE